MTNSGPISILGTVSVIDTATNNVTATVPVGTGPFGVAINPDGKEAYVANIYSNTTSVINTTNNTVIATVPVGIYPSGVSVTPDGKEAYVVNVDGTVSVIDTTKKIVIAYVDVENRSFVIGQFIGKGPSK